MTTPLPLGHSHAALLGAPAPGDPHRVLVVAPQPFYQDRGTPIAVWHVLTALSQLGYHVDVLTLPLGRLLAIPGVRYLRVPNWLRIHTVPVGFSFRKVWFDLFLFAALRKRLRTTRYCCIHALEEAGFLAVLAARGRVPVLYDMQSSLAEQMSSVWPLRNRFAKRFLYACERWLLRRADQTVCSAGLAARVLARLPDARIREWQYPGTRLSVAKADVAGLRRSLEIAEDRPLVVYTGNFEEYQGLPALIAAIPVVLARHPRAVFMFVGAEGPRGAAVAQQLAALPADAYRLVPRQPYSRMPAFLALADLLVSPRVLGGNLPLKVLEYVAAGRPIVATAIPAHQALLTDELAVFTEPTSEGLAAGISQLLDDPARRVQLQQATEAFARQHLNWMAFSRSVEALYLETLGPATAIQRADLAGPPVPRQRVSVIMPARNAAAILEQPIRAVLAQCPEDVELELLVVDDGSTDGTAEAARRLGATVMTRHAHDGGNPAAARNLGAAAARGDLLVFLDADCTPADGWLAALLAVHARGAACVGGSLALPPGLRATARWDYYCGWYHAHPKRRAGWVSQHPPGNLSVQRELFLRTCRFTERQPIAYAHEELAWQAELREHGLAIYFEPAAMAFHENRPGFGQLLRRNYRWAYSTIESKADTSVTRLAWLYRLPWLAVLLSVPTAPLQAAYIAVCWLRAGVLEPLLVFPVLLAARLAYGVGMFAGGIRWLLRGPVPPAAPAVIEPESSGPFGADALAVSAAICTRNRPELLDRALTSLLDQEVPPQEILVVDNAPSDERTREAVARYAGRVRYIREPSPGLDVARNRALREARCPVVAFLDDDAVAHPRWAAALGHVFAEQPEAVVCTGRVEAFTISTPAQRLFEANGGFARGLERRRLPADAGRPLHGWPAPRIAWAISVGNGASFAVRREPVLALGGFDEALDRGEALPGGGDLDLFWRVLQQDQELVYEPSVVAWHDHRQTLPDMARQVAGHQRALVAFLCKSARRSTGVERLSILVFLGWRLVKPGARLLKRAVGRDPLPAPVLWRMWREAWRGLRAYSAPPAAADDGRRPA